MRQILLSLSTLVLMGLGFFLYLDIPVAYAVITTTTTIIGWNVPSGATFGNGLIALILPMVTMPMFAAFPLMFDQRGDIIVTMALVGFTAGALIGMLGTQLAVNPTSIPFAMVILSGLLLGVWIWRNA